MAYPPAALATGKTNATPQVNDHPTHHNDIAQAVNDIVAELGTNPSGTYTDVTDRLAAMPPAGTVLDYIGTAAPSGWLMLDGSAHVGADTAYPELWALAPAGWKSGTTLTLPDARGRMAVGYQASQAVFDTIGETGGSRDAALVTHTHGLGAHTHTLAHTHTTDDPGTHTHGAADTTAHNETLVARLDGYGGASIGVTDTGAGTGIALRFEGATAGNGAHTHTTNSQSTSTTSGPSAASDAPAGAVAATDANLPPYIVLAKIIKAH
jgi:hypothetical protein